MPDVPDTDLEAGGDDNAAGQELIEKERAEVREFVAGLSPGDINSGDWFPKLIVHALGSYTDKVDWRYLQERYKGLPPDAVVDQRIKLAARYAALEGGLSAGVYLLAYIAALGPRGGAPKKKATILAAGGLTLAFDLAYITQLQLRLAHDVAVLYRVPIDPSDPEDLRKLIRVALTIRSTEAVREGAVKVVPVIVRPVIKRYYSGPVLSAAKGLPVVGKYLLQRNAIKIGIPLVGVPLATVVNRYSTKVAGRHAQSIFRNEARVMELAENLSQRSEHPQLTLWVAWLVIKADDKISDDETLLMRHLVRLVEDRHQVVDEDFARVVDLDPAEVWRRLDAEPGDTSDLLEVAKRVAKVDGAINALERVVISELQKRCGQAGQM